MILLAQWVGPHRSPNTPAVALIVDALDVHLDLLQGPGATAATTTREDERLHRDLVNELRVRSAHPSLHLSSTSARRVHHVPQRFRAGISGGKVQIHGAEP